MSNQIILNNSEWNDTVRQTYRAAMVPSIAFKPAFADLTGSTNAALMLSQAYYWTDGRTRNKDGWFFKTALEWYQELRLTRREQEGARMLLKEIYLIAPDGEEIPIWEDQAKGVPQTLYFRINEVALAVALTIMEQGGVPVGGYTLVAPRCLVNIVQFSQIVESSFDNLGKLVSPKSENLYTESTTKNTSEINGGDPALKLPAKPIRTANGTAAKPDAPAAPGPDPIGPSPADILGGRKSYRNNRIPSQVDHAQTCTKEAGEMGLTPEAWVAYYTRLAEICKQTPRLDDDQYAIQVRDWAIRLLKLELRNVEALDALASLWIAENGWRSSPVPTPKALAEYQALKLSERTEKTTKVNRDTTDPKIWVEESLIDGNATFWSPTQMRRSRFEKLKAEGRKIRLAENVKE